MAHDSTMRSHSVTQRLCLWRAVTKLLWASWVQWIHAVSMSYSQLWPRVSSLGKLFSFCHSWVGIKKKKRHKQHGQWGVDGRWRQVRQEKVNSTVDMMVWMPQTWTDKHVSHFITNPHIFTFIFHSLFFSTVQAICLQKGTRESVKIHLFSSGSL